MLNRRQAVQNLAGLMAAPAVMRGARRTPGDKPNLLFIWTDQQRADTMAAYGNHRFHVPMMNRLAAESVVFDRAYVTQPVCTPSRSSVMTGLWPHTSGCVRNNIPLPAQIRTVPELLADSGYSTGYLGKWHLGDEVFAQHGFQEWAAIEDGIYEAHYSAGRDKSKRSEYFSFLSRLGYKPDSNNVFSRGFASKLPVEHSKPSFLATEASRFLMKHRNEPWMLYVNFLEPHTPFASALNDLHTEEEAPLPGNYPGIPAAPDSPEPVSYQQRRAGFLSEGGFKGFDLRTRAGFQRASRNYAGLCSLVDQALGRILWSLEASGQMENTIIVYTSDHGEMMGSHSLVTKQVMYEEAVRVPHLVRVPFRHLKPHHVPQPVSHIDIVPTVLDLLGRKERDGLAGESLVPLLENKQRRGNDHVFLEWTGDSSDQPSITLSPDARTVISPDGWKLALYDKDHAMLFDRNKDPLEMHNLYGRSEHAGTARKLRAQIEGWQKKTNDKMPLPDPSAGARS